MKTPKPTSLMPFLLALLLLASNAQAQPEEDRQTEIEKETASAGAISAARSQYAKNAMAEGISRDANVGAPLAQLSRRPPMPLRRGHASGNYRTPWMDRGNGHALIGAAIGFGLGAAIGAKANTDGHPGATVGAVVIFGGLGALIGGVIGANHGGPYSFAHHRRIFRPSSVGDGESDLSADSGSSHFENAPVERPASASTASLR